MLAVWNLYECVRKNVETNLYVRLNLEHIFRKKNITFFTRVKLILKSHTNSLYVRKKKIAYSEYNCDKTMFFSSFSLVCIYYQ